MNIVYFSQELTEQVPGLLGLRKGVNPDWVWLHDLQETMARRETIHIRPATEIEEERASALIALNQINVELARKMVAAFEGEE